VSPQVDDDIEIEIIDEDEDTEVRQRVYDQIIDRCELAKIKWAYEQYDDEEPDLVLQMPAGRATVRLPLYSTETAESLLSFEFEKFRFLETYDGVSRYDQKTVEIGVGISTVRVPLPANRIFGRISRSVELVDGRILLDPGSDTKPTISLGPPSGAFAAFMPFGRSRHLTIQFKGGIPQGHDEVVTLAERYSNALFFQIDLQSNIALTLNRRLARRASSPRQDRKSALSLEYPRYEYDSAPMALYWYARGASGLPLLQFLAFYQVVEYFFPLYSRSEAQRRIRGILKDPSFRADREADIGRIVACIRESRGAGFFDERTQLRATINEVTNADDIRKLLEGEYLRAFYSHDYKKVVSTKIPIGNESADLRNDVAERLYNIRCKIVHTKADGGDGEVELLLPNSPEEQHLGADIELISSIARACLIASGSPMP
jgi:hypothetical protein